GLLGKEIEVIQASDGSLRVFGIGTDDNVWQWRESDNNMTWWHKMGLLGSDLDIIQRPDGELRAFGVGTDDNLWQWQESDNNMTWWHKMGLMMPKPTNKEGNSNQIENPLPPVQPSPTWQKPLANYRIERGFTGPYPAGHQGIDLAANLGNPVEAAKNGTVSFVGWYPSNQDNGGYGLYVKVNHGNGEETVYAHLSQTLVTVGQQVTADTIIGKVGSTGNSTGPHLHFEVRVNGVAKNPQNYIGF
ncbi:peptidoglycan DD-metalloendopeptidase family protein, partial [Kamptonema sp. UHCC 0994]|uniref:peptidoglycan DD-metalloendopeptidase family protein n=1 Tax=Kamptonema sp. UHCC 0994 TaxID=3031329 RepID=UPI0023BB06B4